LDWLLIAISIFLCYGFAYWLARSWSNGDDDDHAFVVIFLGLYWRANRLERDQSVVGVGDAAYWLTKRHFSSGDAKGLTGSCLSPEFPAKTTERYLGCKQNLGHPVNDRFDLGVPAAG